MDVLDRAANFLLIPCACGVRLKIPPALKVSTLKCPRCGRSHEQSRAESAGESGQAAGPGGKSGEDDMIYRRTTSDWESFKCVCDHPIQISPAVKGPSVECRKCKRTVRILPPA